MAAIRLKWSSLLHLTELDFEPEPPAILKVSDEIMQSISWLTGATQHDRKLLRCDENGHLVVCNPWEAFSMVQEDELYPESANPKTAIFTEANKGCLITTSTQLVHVAFVQVQGGGSENVHVPANSYYWYPHSIYSVTISTVPDPLGTASWVGVNTYG